MYTIIFYFLLWTGAIEEAGNVDGRPIYDIPEKHIENAYKGEILEYLKTKTFEYNETTSDQ